MALPSVVTLGSMAFVVAAAAGYAVISTGGDDAVPAAHEVTHHTPPVSAPTTAPPTHAPQHHQPKPDVVPNVLVVVFNNTAVTGLADERAATLRDAGWNVAATDNWYGNIPEDTVYYPPQLKADAAKLAKVLDITRLHAAVAPMQFDRLTVIIATS